MKRAIHFGAGKIGRGFIGALLSQAGYEVCFADVDPQVVEAINRRGGYTVHVTDEVCTDLEITGVTAVRSDGEAVVGRLAEADLVTTAVGLGILPRVAPVIAAGLRARKAAGVAAPLNIVACENGVRATSRLRAAVYEALDADTAAWADQRVGFADSSVDRIVPPIVFPEPLDVAVEAFHEWNVERSAWVGELPQLEGMHLTDTLEAHVERKLFTLNTGHCSTAYLGYLRGCVTIAEALADERIFAAVKGAMEQSGEALIRKFGFDRARHVVYIDAVLRRFRNPYLRDTVARVGHDPVRKLSAPLYFAYPITLAAGYGLPVDKLAFAAAAALRFDDPADAQCAEIRATIADAGLRGAIRRFTGIDDETIVGTIADAYARIPAWIGGEEHKLNPKQK